MPRPLIELLCALLVSGLCIAGFFEATRYAGPSGYLPKTVMALGFFLALIWALQSALQWRKEGSASAQKRVDLPRLSMFIGLSIAYIVLIPLLGYFTATLLFIPTVTLLLGYRKKPVLFGAPVIFVTLLYLLFGLVLQVQLPDELLFQLVGTN
ncbi:hypothetical protein GLV89_08205 [Halomonas alkaliantarctica]|nr:hypothetical protein [Halomonas alkaliantarctica]